MCTPRASLFCGFFRFGFSEKETSSYSLTPLHEETQTLGGHKVFAPKLVMCMPLY